MSFEQLKSQFDQLLWGRNLKLKPRWQARLIGALRITYVVIRDTIEGMPSMRAMSLVYTTLLSLVPLLAVSFSVLKGFGVHNQIEPMLLNLFTPLGEKGVEITTRIIEFVDNMKAGVLGSVGLGLLVFTVISLMQKIERAFNATWNVTQHRSFAQRFSNYMSVIIVGPLLIFSAIGLTATMMSHSLVQHITHLPVLGWLMAEANRALPYALIIGAFTFVYVFIPNTKVRISSALVGAIVAGAMWETTGWAFASFIANSTKYTAIYSAFATLIFFIIWLYLGWLILLTGASIAYYHQHPEALSKDNQPLTLDNYSRERLSLLLLRLIGQRFYQQQSPWSIAELAEHTGLPEIIVTHLLHNLQRCGFLCSTDDNYEHYVPAVPFEETQVAAVLQAIRCREETCPTTLEAKTDALVIEQMMGRVDEAIQTSLGNATLKDMALMDLSSP